MVHVHVCVTVEESLSARCGYSPIALLSQVIQTVLNSCCEDTLVRLLYSCRT